MNRTAVLILAAGKGTRLKSQWPKVLHEAGGRSLLLHVIAAAQAAGIAPEDMYVVAGYAADRVRAAVEPLGVHVVLQEPQNGSGHAVQVAVPVLANYDRIVILSGDMPLVSAGTVSGLLTVLADASTTAVLATATPASPRAYGRILRSGELVTGIVEDRLCTPEQKGIRELNAGFYGFKLPPLRQALGKLTTDNPHGELYLTDTIGILVGEGHRVRPFPLADADEILGINDRAELVEVDRRMRRRAIQALLDRGVTVYAPETVQIDAGVAVGSDTVIEAGVQLLGQTRVGANCRIRAYAILEDTTVGDGVLIRSHCVLESARIEDGAIIGPYTRLREGAAIGPGAHVGNFVEVKKSRLGRGSKANHLAYIGDSRVGERVNVGAGTITCNYDGVHKHATTIGDGSFIGSNATLVAPVEIGADAYIAAGSTITAAVPAGALGVGRGRQENKPGWVARRKAKERKAEE